MRDFFRDIANGTAQWQDIGVAAPCPATEIVPLDDTPVGQILPPGGLRNVVTHEMNPKNLEAYDPDPVMCPLQFHAHFSCSPDNPLLLARWCHGNLMWSIHCVDLYNCDCASSKKGMPQGTFAGQL